MKNVYNVSEMTEAEAESVIEEKEGNLCVRLYRRTDGTVITTDCPVGVRRKRVTRIAVAALAFGGVGVAFASFVAKTAETDAGPDERPTVTLVETHRPAQPTRNPAQGGKWSLWDRLFGEDEVEVTAGGVSAPPPAITGSASPVVPHRLGRMATPPKKTPPRHVMGDIGPAPTPPNHLSPPRVP